MGSISKLERARLYLVAGAGNPKDHKVFKAIEEAVEGGVDILQLRDYSLSDSELLSMAHQFRALTRRYRILFIVNNRPDIARLADADGVHVGQEDLPIKEVRKIIGEGKVVGVSTHRLEEAQRAISDGADYIGVGPVYPTPTKEGRPAVGRGLYPASGGDASSHPFFLPLVESIFPILRKFFMPAPTLIGGEVRGHYGSQESQSRRRGASKGPG